MASIVLSAAGSAVGAAVGGPFGAYVGGRLGQSLGSRIDSGFLPGAKLSGLHGPRLAELGVQSSTYGRMIPVVYGHMRIAGNIIWSLPIRETATTSSSSAGGGGKGGGRVTQSATRYSYSVTLAIGICEGPVDEVTRVWADAQQLDLSQFTVRLYRGDEAQLPDSLIVALEGAERTPAFRGLAYAVFEDFPMADYGNRIPNFTFEVRRSLRQPDYGADTLEGMVEGMVMIPGGGEFVYDTQVESKIPGVAVDGVLLQQGHRQFVNMHTPQGVANALVSLDQMARVCPSVAWVSVVVSWFGTALDAGACEVLPGVEFNGGGITYPDDWRVAGFTRASARAITTVDGKVQYGGTPDDGSLLRYLDALRARGYKVALYPLLFMDVPGKPWRGLMTGSPADVTAFFTRANGYNAFITHYAALAAGRVDAFIIGSELKGLTGVTDAPGHYPAVDALVALAGAVKAALGAQVVVTYAADWSEYHHTDGGWYHLDPLWASPDIDVIGIDAYFPLQDGPQQGYDIDALKAGWTSGEGYDWYYSDAQRTVQVPLGAPYAWKNIAWFWSQPHINPDSSVTAWVPESKKIWFTEYGFPSVDGAANQPNVFYSAGTAGSAFPYHSRGRVDVLAQRAALTATQLQWKDSPMVERLFLWSWDARPFPYWPDLTGVWSDGADWKTGHWVQGKLGLSSLAAIVRDLCLRAGLQDGEVDVSRLAEPVEGMVIAAPQSYRSAIEALQAAYFFDAVESGAQLKFVPRGSAPVLAVGLEELAAPQDRDGDAIFVMTRLQEVELPKRVNVVFLSRAANYQTALQYAQRQVTESRESFTLDLPVVCTDTMARSIAERTLYAAWMGRTAFRFALPVKCAQLEPGDVALVSVDGVTHRMRVTATRLSAPSLLAVEAVADDAAVTDFYRAAEATARLAQNLPVSDSVLRLLDMPALPGDDPDMGVLRAGACGITRPWRGAALYRADDGANFSRLTDLSAPIVAGAAVEVLAAGPSAVFDEANAVTVVLLGEEELQSVTPLAVLNGANAALLGEEMLQFTTALLLEPGKYRLSGLLRGRQGTEWAMGSHAAGERFVLLDGRLARLPVPLHLLGRERQYKAVSFGLSLSGAAAQGFTYGGAALKPYSPAHVQGERSGGGDLSLRWVRRTRLDGNWQDRVDVPLHEVAEAYEVDILNGAAVVRTLPGLTVPAAGYSAAQQAEDFGSAQGAVRVRVYQISGLIGRGYAAEAVV